MMEVSTRDRGAISLGIVGAGFIIWSSGLILGNILALRVSTSRDAVVANHGFHGMAYLLFGGATLMANERFVEMFGRLSLVLLRGGLTLLGVLNLYGAYEYSVQSQGLTTRSSEIINYGIPVALLLLGASSIRASVVRWRRPNL